MYYSGECTPIYYYWPNSFVLARPRCHRICGTCNPLISITIFQREYTHHYLLQPLSLLSSFIGCFYLRLYRTLTFCLSVSVPIPRSLLTTFMCWSFFVCLFVLKSNERPLHSSFSFLCRCISAAPFARVNCNSFFLLLFSYMFVLFLKEFPLFSINTQTHRFVFSVRHISSICFTRILNLFFKVLSTHVQIHS